MPIAFKQSAADEFIQSAAFARGMKRSSGRVGAVVATKGWHGADGFLSDVCAGVACSRRKYKYLTKTVRVSGQFNATTRVCCYIDGAWKSLTLGYGFTESRHNTVNRVSRTTGQSTVLSKDCFHGHLEYDTGFPAAVCEVPFLPNFIGVNSCPPHTDTDWVDDWASIEKRCGVWSGVGCPTGQYFGGGTDDDLRALFADGAAAGFVDVTFDPETDDGSESKIGFHVVWDYDWEDEDPSCPTAPPTGGDPTCICKKVRITGNLDVTVALSEPYTWEECYADAVSLVGEAGDPCRRLGPLCPGDTALQRWIFVSRKEKQGATPGQDCDVTYDPAFDGSIVLGGYVAGFPAMASSWVQQEDKAITLQQWYVGRGHFKAYDWQHGGTSGRVAGQYLLLHQFTDACSPYTDTFSCQLIRTLPPSSCDLHTVSLPDGPTLAALINRAGPGMVLFQGWIIQEVQDPYQDPPPGGGVPRCYVEPKDCSPCPDTVACMPPPPSISGPFFDMWPCHTNCFFPNSEILPGEKGNDGSQDYGTGTGGCECA